MTERSHRRLRRDERRALLLERATELFSEHGYEGLSMAQLARETQSSKALVYHYFPSKQRLFEAALADGAAALRARIEPDRTRPPHEQLERTLAVFLAWVDERPSAYATLVRSGAPEVRELLDEVRAATAARILDGLGADGARPQARAAVHGWIAFLEAAVLERLEHGGVERDELCELLLCVFAAALSAAGVGGGPLATPPTVAGDGRGGAAPA